MSLTVLIIYGLCLFFILIFSLIQLKLALKYRHQKKKNKSIPPKTLNHYPQVTIQLPVYNEYYVVERLIDCISKIKYPHHKLEIQVLDDSTDETAEVIDRVVHARQRTGLPIYVLRRQNREGYKAGALENGLKHATGEFIAIFDADFLPQEDFLIHTLPWFERQTGVVQTRWGHINRDYSMLTKLQAFALDAHFSVEQTGRSAMGHFINFNGTAGIWRKACINDAGGWQHDTLTEDLDLSYRAQLKGWKFVYLEDVVSPAELPVNLHALKGQQFRWNKGGAENFRKNIYSIWKNKSISLMTKVHGSVHLLNSSVFLCVLLAVVLSVPALYIKQFNPQYNAAFNLGSVLIISTLALMIFYYHSFKQVQRSKFLKPIHFLWYFFRFLSISMGLSLHNSIAVIEGLSGKKSAFIRTPKYNIISRSQKYNTHKYLNLKLSPLFFFEFFLFLYFLGALILGIVWQEYGLVPMHLMLAFGFGYISYFSLKI
jgi:cellulose synthase/poly-beta-1,6-N-acetylglucosamine synthase-like glycosyltransferase